jgi:hypothetical protein
MEVPWGRTDHSQQQQQQDRADEFVMRRSGEVAVRGTLGQLIERSTSAPPPSSQPPPAKYGSNNDDALVGNVSRDLALYGKRSESENDTQFTHVMTIHTASSTHTHTHTHTHHHLVLVRYRTLLSGLARVHDCRRRIR